MLTSTNDHIVASESKTSPITGSSGSPTAISGNTSRSQSKTSTASSSSSTAVSGNTLTHQGVTSTHLVGPLAGTAGVLLLLLCALVYWLSRRQQRKKMAQVSPPPAYGDVSPPTQAISFFGIKIYKRSK